jgi:hypothetical protein
MKENGWKALPSRSSRVRLWASRFHERHDRTERHRISVTQITYSCDKVRRPSLYDVF